MEDHEVSSSPQLQDSETQPSISPDAKWYMTDITIECLPDNYNHFKPTMMNVEVSSSEREQAEVLLFVKTSTWEWKYNGTIALTNEVTLITRWDEMENFGIVHLVKTELENLKENAELNNQIVREFVTETEGPLLRLVFKLATIRPEVNPVQQGDGGFSDEELREALSKNTEMVFARVLEISDNVPQKPHLLNLIGNILLERFRGTRNVGDIDGSVLAYNLAIQLLPGDDAKFVDFLHDSGVSVLERYILTGNLADIDQAISKFETVVKVMLNGLGPKPAQLNNLGIAFQCRFKHTGKLPDISEAISCQQKAIQLTPEGNADMPAQLNNLGVSFQSRFERTGDFHDISEAISSKQKAVWLTPEGHVAMPGRLTNLGNSFQSRFERKGDLPDISEAILSQQKAVKLTPEGHANMPSRLNNLGISFQRRFECRGDLPDISEAISCQQKAVTLTPDSNADKPRWLNNLGVSFRNRFERTGDLADISESLSCHLKAIQLTPEGHIDMAAWLNNLGSSFRYQFERTGDLPDISEAISSQQKAIQLTPESHAAMPSQLSNLGNSYQCRFECTGDLTDIFKAISCHQKAVQLTPEGHANMPGWLNNLGNSFRYRFEHTGDPADISKAILHQQKAVQLTPEGHADMPAQLNNLGISFRSRFKNKGDLADISEALSYHQKAVQLTPEGHAAMPGWLNNLGHSFLCLFQRTGDPADIDTAISNYKRSATYLSGSPSIRLHGAKEWARLSQSSDPSQLLEAYGTVINLISLVAGLEQTIQKRYTNLLDISELSSSAAAAAFRFQKQDLALQWLEQGRCLVWSQLNDLRTPLDDLRAYDPALADDVLRVSRALENAGSRAEPAAFTAETTMAKKMSIRDEATAYIKLAQQWDQLLIKVRAIPQFVDFLRPALCSTLLKNIPNSGPVVVINIHKDRSDALALVSVVEEPLHIALHEFSYEKADTLRRDLSTHLLDSGVRMRGYEPDTRGLYYKSPVVIKDILRQLWTFVVKPILNGLGFSASPSNLPRIWWCATGPLAFLPIHAAGIYTQNESTPRIHSTLCDFAVSSYTPTVRALVERVQSSRKINQRKMGLLMISQPDTPMLRRIPGTTVEVRGMERLLANYNVQHLCLESENATVNEVRTKMDTHSCIHFACHAAQDTANPLQSGFYLHDGRLELSAIIKEQLIGADLAFLSACQTSTGDEKLSEEAVHLAGGMLAAGYRGVVATMWSIGDRYGPEIAEDFYKNLLSPGADDKKGSEGLHSDGAARALHYATQQIRQRLGDTELSLLTWVPYVHFGL